MSPYDTTSPWFNDLITSVIRRCMSAGDVDCLITTESMRPPERHRRRWRNGPGSISDRNAVEVNERTRLIANGAQPSGLIE
jgi:hypothetical protein